MSDDQKSTNDCTNYKVKINRKDLLKKREKVTCPTCGFQYSYSNKTNHLRTKKHKEAINKNKLDDMNKQVINDYEILEKLKQLDKAGELSGILEELKKTRDKLTN